MKDLLQLLRSPETDKYRSIPFWSWNNLLDKEELVRQLEEMKAAGIGGAVLHARLGLRTEYLSEDWFACMAACLEAAGRLDMELWIYDENGWPSGFVGGKLLENPDFRAQFLRYEIRDAFDPEALAVYALDEKGEARRLKEGEGAGEYHCVYLHTSPANTDILNPDVVSAFIAETHEKYYARFADQFGKTLRGFFTDEPQYYRYETPYTRMLVPAFRERYGEDVLDGLVYLFRDDEASRTFRYRYYAQLNRLYTENYYKRLYDWCTAHGCQLTGHSVEENRLYTQMWGGAGAMPSYEVEHMPAIDWLARGIDCEISPKQVASVAAQAGKQFILTETFGCSGWDATPRELKNIAQFQYIYGVNRMCQHLTSYSLAGQGKLDHPPCFSHHMVWWEDYKVFNDYFARLGCLVGSTREQSGVGVLHPMRDIWLHYDRQKDIESVRDVEGRFDDLVRDLTDRSIPHQYLDETVLEHLGRVEGKTLKVGHCAYDTVLVPVMEAVAPQTAKLLREFSEAGGKLCLLGGDPKVADGMKEFAGLKGNLSYERLCAGFDCPVEKPGQVLVNFREEGKLVLALNTGDPCRIGLKKDYVRLDLEGLTEAPVGRELALDRYELAVLLEKGPAAGGEPDLTEAAEADLTDRFVMTAHDPNNLTLDLITYSKDGKTFGPPRYVYAASEELIKAEYRGKLWVRYAFTCGEGVEKLTLRAEKAQGQISVNGRPLELKKSDFDLLFVEGEFVPVPGENFIVRELDYVQADDLNFILYDPMATESLRNCLTYQTEIEPMYLRGDFTVDRDRCLRPAGGKVGITDIQEQGYPYFGGKMRFAGETDFEGGRAFLRLSGRFMTADLKVNGRPAGTFVLNERMEITPFLVRGRNTLELTLKSSLRNTFGPHHFKPDPEPMAVSPFNFTLLGTWQDGNSPYFTPDYQIVPFGLNAVTLEIRK